MLATAKRSNTATKASDWYCDSYELEDGNRGREESLAHLRMSSRASRPGVPKFLMQFRHAAEPVIGSCQLNYVAYHGAGNLLFR